MQKAILYCRVSTREQAETGHSLEAQQELLKVYATQKGLAVAGIIAVPESASGARERVHFAEMLARVRREDINHIVVEKVDRMSRNIKEAVKLQDWVEEEENRCIHFVKQSLIINKNSKSHDAFMWDIFLSIARQYSRNLSEEVRKGQAIAVKKGFFVGANKIGYLSHGAHGVSANGQAKTPNPATKGVIKEIFTRIASGQTAQSVWQWVSEGGKLTSTTGNKLHRSRFYEFIRDPFVCGQFYFAGALHEGAHKPIISKKLFYEVQDILDGRKNHKKSKHNYIYKGLVVNANGKKLYCMTPKGYPYYYSKGLYILQSKVDEAVIKWFQSIKFTDRGIENLRQAVHAYTTSFSDNRYAERTAAMRQLDLLDARLEAAQNKWLDGLLENTLYKQIKMRIGSEREHILQKLPENQTPKSYEFEPVEFTIKALKNMGKVYPRASDENKRALAQLFIHELVCDKGNIYIKAKSEVQALLAPLKLKTGEPSKDATLTIIANWEWYESIAKTLNKKHL